jgi:hypothetical protein
LGYRDNSGIQVWRYTKCTLLPVTGRIEIRSRKES